MEKEHIAELARKKFESSETWATSSLHWRVVLRDQYVEKVVKQAEQYHRDSNMMDFLLHR